MTTTDDSPPSTSSDTNVAVQRYATVNSYMAYEGQTYWTRAQFFLTANALLTAFALPVLPTTLDDNTVSRLAISTGASLAGIALTWLWVQSLRAGEYWLNHWQGALKELEGPAFGASPLLHRDFPVGSGRLSAKKIAHQTALLFYIVWAAVLLYVLVYAVRVVAC